MVSVGVVSPARSQPPEDVLPLEEELLDDEVLPLEDEPLDDELLDDSPPVVVSPSAPPHAATVKQAASVKIRYPLPFMLIMLPR
ncbi:MAG: hypothetical protein QM820_19765 [Minicystis sp.]